MDEVEFARAMSNLKVLVKEIAHVDARNALLVVTHLLDGLNDRITELQAEESDDE